MRARRSSSSWPKSDWVFLIVRYDRRRWRTVYIRETLGTSTNIFRVTSWGTTALIAWSNINRVHMVLTPEVLIEICGVKDPPEVTKNVAESYYSSASLIWEYLSMCTARPQGGMRRRSTLPGHGAQAGNFHSKFEMAQTWIFSVMNPSSTSFLGPVNRSTWYGHRPSAHKLVRIVSGSALLYIILRRKPQLLSIGMRAVIYEGNCIIDLEVSVQGYIQE